MSLFIFLSIFILGVIIGSFLNVVIFRLNTGKSISKGRSICMTCNRILRWYELIPVISYVIQGGKCRRCKEKISEQYPLVELLTGLIFLLIARHFLPILLFSPLMFGLLTSFYSFIFSILIVISVYDIRHKIIPDKLVYWFIFFAFISSFVNQTAFGSLFIKPSILTLCSGLVLASPFAFLWLVSRGKWMGFGDAKLMVGLGYLLGISFGLAAIVLSFWIGAVISLAVMFFGKVKLNMKTEIPFAPFLIVSTLIVFLLNLDIYTLSSFFNF